METSSDSSSEGATSKDDGESSWWQSWGQTILDTVKAKSATTMDMVSKDLTEFYNTIQYDTANKIADTATTVQEKLQVEEDEEESSSTSIKKGLSSFLQTISSGLKSLTEEESNEVYHIVQKERGISDPIYDRKEVIIYEIQTDPGTYCNEPNGPEYIFKEWLDSFNIEEKRSLMSDMLVKNPGIRTLYTQLVPNVVSHSIFWQRYFYRINQFEKEEAYRAALVARANVGHQHDDSYGWEDDEDALEDVTNMAEISSNIRVIDQQPNETIVETDRNEMPESELNDPVLNANDDNEKTLQSISDLDYSLEDIPERTKSKGEHLTLKENEDNSSIDKDMKNINTGILEMNETSVESSSKSLTQNTIELNSILLDSHKNIGENISLGQETKFSTPATTGTDSELLDSQKSLSNLNDNLHKQENSSSFNSNGNNKSDQNECSESSPNGNNKSDKLDCSESSSTASSWISIDDELRVKRSHGEQAVNGRSHPNSPTESGTNGSSSMSSAVLVEKNGTQDEFDDDDDFDLDDDVNEDELQKIVQQIKDDATSGELGDDDDDWENWD